MSWKPEVIADSSGKWCGNALRFATKAEAEANVLDLSYRWTSVRETRVVESDEPVNYKWVEGRLVEVIKLDLPEPKPFVPESEENLRQALHNWGAEALHKPD